MKRFFFLQRSFLSYLTILLLAVCLFAGTAEASKAFLWEPSSRDKDHIKNAHYWVKKKKWDEALAHAKKSRDPSIYKSFYWWYLTTSSQPSFRELARFTKANPDWPRIELLQRKAEQKMTDRMKVLDVIRFFEKKHRFIGKSEFRTPLTGKGKRLLAEAQLALKYQIRTDKRFINRLIRNAWIEENFASKKAEKTFLSTYHKRIKRSDHIKRIDRLLWEEKIAAAERLLPLIDAQQKKIFEARIKLIQNHYGVDTAISALPKKALSDEGLLYNRILWRERNGKSSTIPELLLQSPKNPQHADEWWKLKVYFIRELLDEKDYKTAYKLSTDHGLSPGVYMADAEWLAGWISLRFLNQPSAAYKHFSTLYDNVTSPISLGRASYWAGRASEERGNPIIAEKWYRTAATYPSSFYGQLATEKIGKAKYDIPKLPKVTRRTKKNVRNNPLVKAAYIFDFIRRENDSKRFLKQAISTSRDTAEKYLITRIGVESEKLSYSIAAAKTASRSGALFIPTLYPIFEDLKDTPAHKLSLDKAFIHSIIRQESLFEKNAKSSAGAIGMMQLMPATSREAAKLANISYRKNKLTSDPIYNIRLGSAYLNELVQQFDGSYILAIAAYNAGPNNVKKWLSRNGDPRKMTDIEEIIDWMEKISFKETRNYVQRVLENLQIYRTTLSSSSKRISLAEDLTR